MGNCIPVNKANRRINPNATDSNRFRRPNAAFAALSY
jgi:hypothetical protein